MPMAFANLRFLAHGKKAPEQEKGSTTFLLDRETFSLNGHESGANR